ncbi:Histone acetyltransferase [Coniochaeta hoffmannii]|uniref:histone acetyltransferase n=1 Tax=Coniochaeta hoffmannii TaxID=91930 RepID=A0AA38SHN6_9PEZI|nr:Histone acetyltransferase [Coniochaeta hoffmannii]
MTSTKFALSAKGDTNTKSSNTLVEKLAPLLPKGFKFGIYHLSTPPTRTEALYSAPPGERPDKTYREDHFLAVSIDVEPDKTGEQPAGAGQQGTEHRRVLVLALEVFLFTTAFSTTLFVSKADSTGYLNLLKLPKGSPSPIREISAAFVSFLVEHRQRKGIQTVVSLFARAQSQYLFPGSVDNKGKHVLDDRGLVKWWCRVLNPLIEASHDDETRQERQRKWSDVKGYLVVPGLDRYETRAFLPRDSGATVVWTLDHPLERISHYTKEYDWVPLRCLIPKFPDDPKSRFRDELDVEASKSEQDTGLWKSVKTLDQFWEMMAFRQECSSGRLTGFIWVVFDPEERKGSGTGSTVDVTPTLSFNGGPPLPLPGASAVTPQSSPSKKRIPASAESTPIKSQSGDRKERKKKKKQKKKLKGIIVPREPKIKTRQRNYLLDHPTSTAFYHWPPEGRGEKIVDETSYKRIVELLLHLDFATLDKACGSTARWISEVGVGATWGTEVTGKREIQMADSNADQGKPAAAVNDLAGLIKRNRADNGPTTDTGATGTGESATQAQHATVNVLGTGLIRKKRKDVDSANEAQAAQAAASDTSAVNVLAAGLVRKKPKVV